MIKVEEKSMWEHHKGPNGKSRETCDLHQVLKVSKGKEGWPRKKCSVLIDLIEDEFKQ